MQKVSIPEKATLYNTKIGFAAIVTIKCIR